jgi:hypothetical protein
MASITSGHSLPGELQLKAIEEYVAAECAVINLRDQGHLDAITSRLINDSKIPHKDKARDNIRRMVENAI